MSATFFVFYFYLFSEYLDLSKPGPTGAYVIVFFSSPISTAELFPHLLRCLSDPVYVVADLVPEPVIRVLNVLNVVIPAVITEPCYCP